MPGSRSECTIQRRRLQYNLCEPVGVQASAWQRTSVSACHSTCSLGNPRSASARQREGVLETLNELGMLAEAVEIGVLFEMLEVAITRRDRRLERLNRFAGLLLHSMAAG